MSDFCADCANLDRNDCKWEDRYYCLQKKQRVKMNDKACNYFIHMSNMPGFNRSGCYITTIICNILGYEDNCEVLQLLRDFRDNYLKRNEEFFTMLYEYDKIGPIISDKLISDIDSKRIAMELLQNFIIPCAQNIKVNNYDEAIFIYKNMVNMLKVKYNLIGIKLKLTNDIPLEDLGKGRIRQKKNTKVNA